MNVLKFDYDTEAGFAWIEVEAGTLSGDERWAVQCCLATNIDDPRGPCELKIICSDCGADWGICGEINEKAFSYYGENRCMQMLFNAAKNAGIEVQGL